MKADRELDARIAEEVMGHINFYGGEYIGPHYSTQIADAMPVFDKTIEKEGIAVITRYAPEGRAHYWEIEWGYRGKKVRSDTLPHTICLAALAVVERRE